MFRILLKKYAHESALLWLACGTMLFIFPWIRIWTVSQFELSGFAALLDQIRILEKYSPVPLEQFLTYEGVVGLTFDEPILILCVLVWSISRGSDLVSGEIGRGTMEMLMAQPISRLRIAMAHGIVTIGGLMLLVLFAYLGIVVGIETNSVPYSPPKPTFQLPGIPFSLTNPLASSAEKTFEPLSKFVSPWTFLPSSINLFGLGFVVFGLTVLVSSWDQYRWRTIGFTVSIYVLQLLTFILAKSLPWTKPLMLFSFLSCYQPDWTIQVVKRDWSKSYQLWVSSEAWTGLGPAGFTLVLILLGGFFYVVGITIFLRRDIPAPA